MSGVGGRVLFIFALFSCACVIAAGAAAHPAQTQSDKKTGTTAPDPAEGAQRFQTHCGRCHNPPSDLSSREARAVLRQMRVRAMLSAEDEKLILQAIAPGVAATASASGLQRIEIVASRSSYSPSKITLTKDKPVILAVTSSAVTHDLSIKELGIETEIKKGRTAEIALTPTMVGIFEGQCRKLCGDGLTSAILIVNVVDLASSPNEKR